MRSVILAAIVLPVLGCTSPTMSDGAPLTVTMAVGQEVLVQPDGISFRLDSIVSDSRCPVEVICVQAGSVLLGLTYASPAHPAATSLLLDSSRPDSSSGVLLSVTGVEPIRHQGILIAPGDYRIQLTFGRP